MIAFVPAIAYLLGITPSFLGIYPANVCMDLIEGRGGAVIGLVLTAAWILLFLFAACRSVVKMWIRAGGVKL